MAVDASVWLTQFVRAMRDAEGMMLRNAHLLGFFRRCCKLLFHYIRPVFVFDGQAHPLKRKTLERRRSLHEKQTAKLKRVAERMVLNRLQARALDNHVEIAGKAASYRKRTRESPDRIEPEAPNTLSQHEINSQVDDGSNSLAGKESPRSSNFDADLNYADLADDDDLGELPDRLRVDTWRNDTQKLRAAHRERIVQVAESSPKDFSRAQISNFLRSTKQLQDIRQTRRKVSGIQGEEKRVASDSKRTFIFRKKDPANEDILLSTSPDERKSSQSARQEAAASIRWATSALQKNSTGRGSALPIFIIDEEVQQTAEEGEKSMGSADDMEWEVVDVETEKTKDPNGLSAKRQEDEEIVTLASPDVEVKRQWPRLDGEIITLNSPEPVKASGQHVPADEFHSKAARALDGFLRGLAKSEQEDRGCSDEKDDKEEDQGVNESGETFKGESTGTLISGQAEPGVIDSAEYEVQKAILASLRTERISPSELDKYGGPSEVAADFVAKERGDSAKPSFTAERIAGELETKGITGNRSSKPCENSKENANLQKLQKEEGIPTNASAEGDGPRTAKGSAGRLGAGGQVEKSEPTGDDSLPETVEEDEIRPIIESRSPEFSSPLDDSILLTEAALSASEWADLADDGKEEQIKAMRLRIGQEGEALQQEVRARRAASHLVSDEMYAETRDMLRLFGIPYIEAPYEAEAQCAWLNEAGLVDGVVTEDSDAFLFGALNVYRNMFNKNKYVEGYEMKQIEEEMGMTRSKLIRLALLLGSDYTDGVRGVGIVNAAEILEAFPGPNGLEEFREWVDKKITLLDEEPSEEELATLEQSEAIRREFCWKHRNIRRNWEIREGFPNAQVVEAYEVPECDRLKAKFTWTKPDFDMLRRFCWEKFGWKQEKADELLNPLEKELERREQSPEQVQTRIDKFFKPERFALIRSQRLGKAIQGMAGPKNSSHLVADKKKKPKQKREGRENRSKRGDDEGTPLGLD
eukprot:CAMPEP_0113958484 /NCGR_PEP_ID=MMETSP0011_2-20120614/3457_1 /TAXON_ID=101924 /ORGANISM="Rhodosorus marinus" /LENGTH=982 /DNA_ID=CAMNT_0000969375 /DNA_START=261 /DNA_END=3209 /DNA_ORIENTATION=+ /assembly_acc=CAM_ASM_000156